jgi:hypothetical protein
MERGEHLKAERTLAKVLFLAPDLPEAHYRMGQLLARRGSLSAARRSFLNVFEIPMADEEDALRWASLIGAELSRLERG